MVTDEDEARWKRRMAAVKALVEEADDLFVCLCSLDSEEATHERTAARAEVYAWVARHPRYNAAARRAILTATE